MSKKQNAGHPNNSYESHQIASKTGKHPNKYFTHAEEQIMSDIRNYAKKDARKKKN